MSSGSIASKIVYGAILSAFISFWILGGFVDLFYEQTAPYIGILSYPAGIFLMWLGASALTWVVVKAIRRDAIKETEESA